MSEDGIKFGTDGYTYPPVPYREEDDPNKFWGPDLYDSALPKQKGFLTDMVYFMRGMEVPTLFTLWSGLWLLSTVIKREAWLKWFPLDMFPNLYVILAGPAGSKKSTTIDDVGMPILERMQQYMYHPNVRRMKNINVVKDKMTPEALLDAMLPGNKKGKASFVLVDDKGNPLLDEHNRPLRYKATSETGIVLSEMTSSIGKRSYTEGFVEILLDLYNPKERWEWRTRSEGAKYMYRTYVTLLAATTPTAFKESVPKVAAGDGFLSRCVTVYQSMTNRRFSMPRSVENGPTLDELAMRLAWIAEKSLGAFTLSEEAFALYDSWYDDHKDFLERNENEGGLRGRMDLNLLKVSLLLRAQRYDTEPENVITEDDMRDAIELLHVTYGLSAELMGELGDEVRADADKVRRILGKYKRLSRVELMRKTHFKADDLNQVLDYLVQVGDITIMLNGRMKSYPSKAGEETYEITDLCEKSIREYEQPKVLEKKRRNNDGRKSGKTVNLREDTERENDPRLHEIWDSPIGSEGSAN
jgi:hypothetical protein